MKPMFLLLQLAACWPVWQWYAKRLAAGNADDQWCLLAVATALVLPWLRPQPAPNETARPHLWILPTASLLLYAAAFHWLPPLLRAVLAMLALGVTMSHCFWGRALPPAIAGLLMLALPVIPLLQFYLGYPLRVLVGAVTAPFLQLAGLAVVREGTCLNWNGQLIAIDAPCSGIRMLWAGMFLCCVVAWLYQLRFGQTVLTALLSLVVIVAGNILRASALFYLEAGLVTLPVKISFAHEGIGIVAFVFTALGIVAGIRWLQQRRFFQRRSVCELASRSFLPVS